MMDLLMDMLMTLLSILLMQQIACCAESAFIVATLYELYGQTTSVSSKKTLNYTELYVTLNWKAGVKDSGTFQFLFSQEKHSTSTFWYLLMLPLLTGLRKGND